MSVARLTLFHTSLIACLLGLTAFAQQSTAPKTSPTPVAVTAATTSNTAAPVPADPLHEALTLYRKGDFDGAMGKYQNLLSAKQYLPDAYAGLVRTYLKKRS